ncbi:hypothetical protein [Paraclostridium sordellii]|uniref:hypothetical protein n=1 Tax=Paraclostridium sordellii TaxID=1505 RepID=UPI0005E7C8F6|nr:hypothetical protein [Paeniclostridium sordellii]CEO06570.1 Uncharacterised protein [[Clostridium] sordellii] [Paeniclostridium sordellii]CEP86587.1 Uncharacterised protein [[Clostridium] sordellii] [Paeniclostridium sordellii]CEP96838.1 Uncharacterised protein [[Clostridium] sordellii] [Paeniclostridium sordellii]CEP99696.1 Uncharacterised protein [[Clostridium] sordellii] [Paeniclostridium sordellii]
MDILGILTGVWIINSGKKLKKTKKINGMGWDPERNVKDKDRYIDLFYKMHIVNGVSVIIWGVLSTLNELFFHLPLKVGAIMLVLVVILAFIEMAVINRKRRKFLY